jgi:outer membrane protein TolC
MLNRISSSIYFSLLILLCSASAKSNEIIVLGLKDALELAHLNQPDSISDNYDYNIRSAYLKWIYDHNRLKILSEKRLLYTDFMIISDLHFKSGEIGIIKKSLTETGYLKVETQYSDAQYDLLISENNLKKLLYTSNDILPESDSLVKYYLPSGFTQVSQKDSIFGLYSDFRARLNYLNLALLLEKYDKQLLYYEKIYSLAQQLISATKLRYDSEDIEYFDYINITGNAIDLKLEYLKVLYLYNQAALKIEIYDN